MRALVFSVFVLAVTIGSGRLDAAIASPAARPPSFRFMVKSREGAPGRCGATRVGACTFATAGHCLVGALPRGRATGEIQVNTPLSSQWLKATATLNPTYVAADLKNISMNDTAFFVLSGEDCELLKEMPIFPICRSEATSRDLLVGYSEWADRAFHAHTHGLSTPWGLEVRVRANAQVAGVISGDSGSGLFKTEQGKFCWLGNLSTSALGYDFSTEASYSGAEALQWMRSHLSE